ncbi:MAG: hypothetical protein Q8O67_25790 [Deltaproteobacteria bacterium]|nr:hypothetical protein [Deltaproteobacteria bacterium]
MDDDYEIKLKRSVAMREMGIGVFLLAVSGAVFVLVPLGASLGLAGLGVGAIIKGIVQYRKASSPADE